ncbi:MAG: 2TM domain-containing protein [Mycetocola sp.]
MDNEELRIVARKRLKAKSDFRQFLWVWLGVSVLLVVIWAVTNPGGYFWPAWPIGGMGVAAFFIGLDAYGPARGIITDDQVDAEIRRMHKQPPSA